MWWENPELVVDISDTMDLKIKALACHRASSRTWRPWRSACASGAQLGKPKGYAYAETFDTIVMDR